MGDIPAPKLDASIGGYTGDSFRVRGDGSRLVYERLAYGDQLQERRELHPTAEAWRAFWQEVEAAGAWEWQRRYEPDYPVMDGTSWSVSLSDGARRVTSSGSNAGPPGMGAVCHAISRLAGGSPFR